MSKVLEGHPEIAGVYSIGGGNNGIVEALGLADSPMQVFIGHDLVPENAWLCVRCANLLYGA